MILERLAKKVGQLAEVSEQILANTLEDNDAFIEDAIAEQMSQGKRGDGSEILPSYDPNYAAAKRALGLQASFVDLKVTGKFHEGERSKVFRNSRKLVIDNTDEKAPFLLKKYDSRDKLQTLNQENKGELKLIILQDQKEGLKQFLAI